MIENLLMELFMCIGAVFSYYAELRSKENDTKDLKFFTYHDLLHIFQMFLIMSIQLYPHLLGYTTI